MKENNYSEKHGNLQIWRCIDFEFSFTEGGGFKRRPVMIIKDTEDGDVLVSKITSKICTTVFDHTLIEWASANLLSPSVIRIHKIQTVSINLILGKIGSLHPSDRKEIRHKLVDLIMKING